MKNRFSSATCSLITVVGSIAVAQGSAPAPEVRPNVILILADDLGWADLPVCGNRFNEAPSLDQLAADGMRFTDAYAACPVCSPTRASLLSGQTPARVGIIDWIPGHWRPFEKKIPPVNRTQHLPLDVTTVAEALHDAGYATALFGKWHLGDSPEHHPLHQGFDQANTGMGYFDVTFDPPREDSKEKIMADRLADFGIQFMEENRDRPFFLILSHWDVHCLLDAEEQTVEKYLSKPPVPGYPCNPVYAASIEHLDRSTGRVLEAVDRLGLKENTVVVFYSDNGGCISENPYAGVEEPGRPGGRMNMLAASKRDRLPPASPLQYIVTSNLPLRGEKGEVYEGGIRVPLIVRWPGRIKPGSVSAAPVSTPDFYPTFLELARAPAPDGQVLDGISLLPALLHDRYDAERPLFWHYPVYHHGVPAAAVRKGDWKLVENLQEETFELFNLRVDIGEQTDLSTTYPEKKKELQALLSQWQKDSGAELPTPNPGFDPVRRKTWGTHSFQNRSE